MSKPISLYRIANIVNGKAYIGQTRKTVAKRWIEHCSTCRNCSALSAAIEKFGKDAFRVETLVVCPTVDYADDLEKKAIVAFNTLAPNGYNLRVGGHAPRGCAPSTHVRLSEAAKKRGVSEACHAARIAAKTGKPLSETQKAKQSASIQARLADPVKAAEFRANVSAGTKKALSAPEIRGKHLTALARTKERRVTILLAPESRAKMAEVMQTESYKATMRQKIGSQWARLTPEQRAVRCSAISAGMKKEVSDVVASVDDC